MTPDTTQAMTNLPSILLMTAGMAAFATADTAIVFAARALPPAEIVAIMGAGGTLVFLALAWARGQPVRWALALDRTVLLRNGAEIVGTLGVVQALAILSLASATAILQATPLVVMLGAAVILGEQVGWRRWLAVLVGFAGVLIMIRPADGVGIGAALALMGVAGLAARDLSTRRVRHDISTIELAVFGFAALVPAGLILMALRGGAVVPDAGQLALMAAVIAFAALGYYCVTASLRGGEVSAVTPFRYTRLVFATLLGIVALRQIPDAVTLGGGAIVVGAGLYALLRERKQARLSPTPLPR